MSNLDIQPLETQRERWKQLLRLGSQLSAPVEGQSAYSWFSSRCETVIKVSSDLLNAQVDLWLSKELLSGFKELPFSSTHQDIAIKTEEPPTHLMRHALAENRLCTGISADNRDPIDATSGPSAAAVPLSGSDDDILGVIQAQRDQDKPFQQEDLDILDGLVIQVSNFLQAALRMSFEHWRVEQLSLVRDVSLQIAAVRDLDELTRQITRLIQRTFRYYYVAIFTLEEEQECLLFRASAGPEDKFPGNVVANMGDSTSPAVIACLGQGLIGLAAQTGEEILANDVSQESRYRFLEPLPETRAEVVLPFKIGDRVLGVLDVQSDQLGDFKEIDMIVLRALAGNIAVAVEGARLYSSLRHRADQLTTVYEVGGAITSVLDQDKLLAEVVNLIHLRFGYPFVHLFTVHTVRRKIIYEAGSGSRDQILKDANYTLDLHEEPGLVPWVARNGETVIANDVTQEPRYKPSPVPPDETCSELTVPLVFGGEVLGVLDVQSDHLDAFGEEDRFLFEALADSIAIALHNAILFRSESWRRQVAESLSEVAGLLSADVDLDLVLEAILTELVRNLPCDVASIWLLDEDNPDKEMPGGFPPLRLSAVYGSFTTGLESAKGLSLQSFFDCNDEDGDVVDPSMGADFLIQALYSEMSVIRRAESSREPLGAALEFPLNYSAIAAPLRIGEQRQGVLMMIHHSPGRYGSEATTMIETYGSYAAVAIENARLFEAAHEQAWVSTVLLQVAEATQTITNIQELMATIVRIIPMLVGVKSSAIYTLDDDGVFIPAASAGLSPEGKIEFERWRFAPGDVSALDDLMDEHKPSLLPLARSSVDSKDDSESRLTDIFTAGLDTGSLQSTGWLIVVCLMGREELIGSFMIHYSPDLNGSSLEEAFDETLSIIQGISQQTAMAIENIRLVKSQKEEAYVSVALLQVAQAVVSTNDLTDILGSIVRLTPILVGNRRVAVFLWDDEHREFTLIQDYGIPRGAEGQVYPSGTFPLLDRVREEDCLIACIVVEETDVGNVLDAWAGLMAPEAQDVEEILARNESLLLAFPLSVQGEVIGVFLVEEPDALSLGESFAVNTNRRMRMKRLEIATGISQQTALAIQNDRFQREMVTRGRLDREMQLAREIQRKFLPDQIPELQNWELNVYWHPAREVAGDFYDFFQLPGNKLGLVIADVADKGIPAALFMTLVRTLMRATVTQLENPADVLAQVNDVLVPDAQQGMFVTLFYCVLCLDTGELIYANAGHNRPLIFRNKGEGLIQLEKGEIALGVLENSRFVGRSLIIQPGDFLVLYTDGITEAFSADDSMYGESGLHETITRVANGSEKVSAGELLREIDRSVQAFVGEDPLEDDLTLVVMRRVE